MALTDKAIRSAKPKEKTLKLFDGNGLYLEISPAGGKWWRMKYRFAGMEKRLSLGVYPTTTLKAARLKCNKARELLANGRDPGAARKAEKLAIAGAESFEALAREWHAKFSPRWVSSHGGRILRRLEKDIFPWLGRRPIVEITAPEVLAVLHKIIDRGAIETAHRAKQNCGQIFRYAVRRGLIGANPASDLGDALPPPAEKHHASITEPRAIGELLRAVNSYRGQKVTKAALQLSPYVFVRPGELRQATWSEIDFDRAEWRIPGPRMKLREQHIVPLSRQAIEILREIEPVTNIPLPGKPDVSPFVFPSVRSRLRPMSNMAILAAIRRMGYGTDEMTGHGFRSMASTQLHELGWNHLAIERQLAHAERNEVSAAYNYAEHLPERRRMMQVWADHLDGLRESGTVIPLRKTA